MINVDCIDITVNIANGKHFDKNQNFNGHFRRANRDRFSMGLLTFAANHSIICGLCYTSVFSTIVNSNL